MCAWSSRNRFFSAENAGCSAGKASERSNVRRCSAVYKQISGASKKNGRHAESAAEGCGGAENCRKAPEYR